LRLDLRHWINDGLMAIFPLGIGLEIKRKLLVGELAERRKAMLPIMAAAGGKVFPALICAGFNCEGAGARVVGHSHGDRQRLRARCGGLVLSAVWPLPARVSSAMPNWPS
jgi:hypothetical protein